MPTKVQRKSKLGNNHKDGGDIAEMAKAIFERVREIKKTRPDVARRVDELELEIRDRLNEIKRQIGMLDKHEQDLVTLLVVQGINKMTEELLIE